MKSRASSMNPFPGLRPFRQDEDYLFFGREEQTMELLQLLGTERFVAVVGTSGSGKSSLVRCGLLSELLGGKLKKAGTSWEVAVAHPGGNPLALLAEAILDADLYDREAENARENLLATLSRSHFGLVEAIKQARLGEDVNFLLVVDQFEEIFRFNEAGQQQQEVANEFVSLLLEAVAQTAVPIYIVLTMRSDFIGDCGQFEGLAEMVNRGEFLIPRLSREQFKRVIEAPIKVAGGQITPRLLQRLLNDLGQQADQLPCLQHALMRTWSVWSERGDGEALDLEDYQRVGRMSEALSLHADEIYNALENDRQRELCAGMFKALTIQESENRGIRRPQRLGALCRILDVPADLLRPIIDAFRQQHVTFLTPSSEVELTDKTVIDISHESLMRVWTRLRRWVDEEAQAAGIYLRLSESAALCRLGKAGLYRDPELGIALAWQESERPNAAWAERFHPGFDAAMAFLAASREATVAEEQARQAARERELEQARQLAEAQQLRLDQQQRAARRLRMMIAALAAVAVIAGLACVAALFANQRANTLAETARQNEDKANQNAKRAEQSQQETAKALAIVASQKAQVEGSLSKLKAAEQARAAAEAGRKLADYTNDMRLAPFVWSDERTTGEQFRVLLAKHVPSGRMKDEGGRMKGENTAAEGSDSSFILHPSSLDLRGFEWDYCQHLLERGAAVFSGHGVSVVDGVFTSNGQLVTLDQNGQVRRWDLDSHDEDEASRRDLPGGPSAQVRVLSPNGRLAALAEGNKVLVFDASTGIETFSIDSANNRFRRLSFSRDSKRLVIVDDKIRWCNAVSGEVIASLDQKFDFVASLALSADGLTLAVVAYVRSPRQYLIFRFRLNATTRTVTPQANDVGSSGRMTASALSPDGQRIAGGGWSRVLSVFDTATGRVIAQHRSAHAFPISAIAFSGDGAKLATADAAGTIKIWADAQKLNSKSTALLTLKGHLGAINTVSFSSDGKRLVTTSADKTARVWDLEDAGAALRPLERSGSSSVAHFSPDGQLIAAKHGSGNVRLWDAATGRLVRELSVGDKGSIQSLAFSPTDNRLLAVGYGGQADVSYVALWDIDAGTELARLPGATDLPDFGMNEYSGAVGALAFSLDGKYLVAGFGSKFFSPASSLNSPLKVWEVATRRLIRRLNGHTGYGISLDFSRDGTLMASGSQDGTAIIWSTETWKATQTLKNPDMDSIYNQAGRRGMVEDVAFSPDGKTLALASYEGTVQLWDVASGKLLETRTGHSGGVEAVVFSPDGRTLASGGSDRTVRLWNVETRRELMQLDPGSIELGQVATLAFAPDGQHLLAGGYSSAAVWSTAPIVWNDSGPAAVKLRLLLQSNADFQSRIRMLSENIRLHEALAKLDAKDKRVQAALAATQANWHASRHAWPEAVAAFDRLVAADPSGPEAWLRMPGLLRLATALLHENRPAVAATLLQGGAKRRTQDGLPAVVDQVGIGIAYSAEDGAVRVTELLHAERMTAEGQRRKDEDGKVNPQNLAHPSSFRLHPSVGDAIVKVNDTELTKESIPKLGELLAGEPGTKVRLTVRHSGSEKPEAVELTRERFLSDPATGELLHPLRLAVNERLAKKPRDAGLLELRAELAGQWSDWKAQVADYTAAIELLSGQKPEAAAAELQRLYRRRGNAFVSLQKWPEAVDDYAHVVTPETTDVDLLSKRARAHEALKNWDAAAADWSRVATGNSEGAKLLTEFARRLAAGGQYEKSQALYERLLEADQENDAVTAELAQLLLDKEQSASPTGWTILKPTEMKSQVGATLTELGDHSILAGGKNAPFDIYTLTFRDLPARIRGLRLEALLHESLPQNGPGRAENGNFELSRVTAQLELTKNPGEPRVLKLAKASADFSQPNFSVTGAIDADDYTAWSIGHGGTRHSAVLELAESVTATAGTVLRVTLECKSKSMYNTHYPLGRFRLSVSGATVDLTREQKRFDAMKITDPWLRLAAAYALNGCNDEASQCSSRALELRARTAAQRPDDREAWKNLGVVRAALGQREAAATAFAKFRELTPESRNEDRWWSPNPSGIDEALATSDEIFARVVQMRPRDQNLLIARFHYYGRRARWKEAAEMTARFIELDPNDEQAREYQRALLLFSGDIAGYHRACREDEARLVAEGKDATDVGFLGQYRSNRPRDAGPPVPAHDPPGNLAGTGPAGGIRDYRKGQIVSAVRKLAEVPGRTSHPFLLTEAHLFLAMAHQRLGQAAEARRELNAAREKLALLGRTYGWSDSTEGVLLNYGWTEWLIATILHREAEALILYDPIFPADPFAR